MVTTTGEAEIHIATQSVKAEAAERSCRPSTLSPAVREEITRGRPPSKLDRTPQPPCKQCRTQTFRGWIILQDSSRKGKIIVRFRKILLDLAWKFKIPQDSSDFEAEIILRNLE